MTDDQDYLKDVLNDELWNSIEPREQIKRVGNAAAEARENVLTLNTKLNAQDVPMTQAYRTMLRQRKEEALAYLELLAERRRRAKAAQTEKNISEANSEATRKYTALKRAVRAHREAVLATDNPIRLDQANQALYMALDSLN